ncbi:hypothetical protein [Pseudomonas nunensis]|uniref:hypothetical protein n=1 Tax=Pseudomonas nunensis TaxID=2961896 RepID=UPI0025AF7B46|nr:hypothetical protein [Pseudomonas nunensis]MDN3220034.1 hypothetical protein [Pseudomonas nunensis]
MEERLQSRSIHIFVFLIILILSIVVGIVWPDLRAKSTDIMAFLGFWVTVFGLCVAIVEIVRLGYTSKGIIKAADGAFNDLKLQMELQDVRSCLEIINISISDLKGNKQIPTVLISRIKQVYIAVFAGEMNTQGSAQHHNILIINSYVHVSAVKRQTRAPQYSLNENAGQQSTKKTNDTKDEGSEHKHKATLDALNKMHDELSMYAASKQLYKEVNS